GRLDVSVERENPGDLVARWRGHTNLGRWKPPHVGVPSFTTWSSCYASILLLASTCSEDVYALYYCHYQYRLCYYSPRRFVRSMVSSDWLYGTHAARLCTGSFTCFASKARNSGAGCPARCATEGRAQTCTMRHGS